jgi:hypothetical protein
MALTERKAKRAARGYWPLRVAVAFLLLVLAAWAAAHAEEWIRMIGSVDEPQYEIKSDKTDHIAMHNAAVLRRLGRWPSANSKAR